MATQQHSVDVDLESGKGVTDMPEEESKPSFLKKVKAKARKLKSKLKSHGTTEDSQDESPRDPLSAGQDESESDTSESDQGDKGDIPYTPLNNAVLTQRERPAGAGAPKKEGTSVEAVTSTRSPHGSANSDDQSFPVDPAVLKTKGPSGHEQAVPTNYSYFNSDPLKAKFPSDLDVSQRERDVPSATGGEFGGLTPATSKCSSDTQNRFSVQDGSLPKSGKSDSELPRSFVGSQDVEQNDTHSVRSSPQTHPDSPAWSRIASQPYEQDQGARLPEPSSMSALTPRNSLNDFSELAGSNASQQRNLESSPTCTSVTDGSNNDRSDTSPREGNALGDDTIGTAEGAKEVMDKNWNTTSESTWTQNAYGLKDSLASTFGYTGNSATPNLPSNNGEQKPFMDRVTGTAYGLKDAVASKFEYADQTKSNDSIPISQKATDSPVNAKDLAANAVDSGDQGLPYDEKPVSAQASDLTVQEREAGLQKTTPDDRGNGLANSISESIVGLPSMLSSKLGFGGGSPASPSPTSAEATQRGSGFKDGSDAPTEGTPDSNTYDPSTRKDTPYPDHPSATSTGLFDRVSDIASSLFGRGPKQPSAEQSDSLPSESKSI